MERKLRGLYTTMTILVVALFMVASGHQIRLMNWVKHPGFADPYMPPAEGPNHGGPSHYTNMWMGESEICESDNQMRLANWQTWFLRPILCD